MIIIYFCVCTQIRKQAIKDLPVFCKESKEYLTKIADILAQLLQADDSQELLTAQNSLLSLFKIDAKGKTFYNIFESAKYLIKLRIF